MILVYLFLKVCNLCKNVDTGYSQLQQCVCMLLLLLYRGSVGDNPMLVVRVVQIATPSNCSGKP